MGTEKSNLRLCCLVMKSITSCAYAIEDGLPDDREMDSVFSVRYWSCYVHMDFNVGVGVNECNCAWWADEQLKPNTIAIKRLLGVEKKVPPTVPDKVDYKAAKDSSTSRATWKSNQKNGCN